MPVVWLIDAYRAGERGQVRALVDALGWPCETKVLSYRSHVFLPHVLGQSTLRGITAESAALLQPPWPDLAVGSEARNGWMLAGFAVFLCRLDAPEAERVCRRLQVRRRTLDEAVQATRTFQTRLPALTEDVPPSEVVTLLEGLSEVGLVVAWAIAPSAAVRAQIVQYAAQWRHVRYQMSSDDLQALGLKPGPRFGRILGRLRAAWLDGEVSSGTEEQALAAELVASGWDGDDGDTGA